MQKDIKLNDGNVIPVLGLGTWQAENNLVGDAVKFALTKASYKHIDCAMVYGNEKEIGEALKVVFSSVIKREDIFITSKLWNTKHRQKDVEKACRQTLSDLGLEYLDLYLMHWGVAFKAGDDMQPVGEDGKIILDKVSVQETWKAMEELVKKGSVRSIGVCNFTTPMLLDLLTYAEVKPVMNQVELHPYNAQSELIEFCQSKDIAVTAYSPLGHDVNKLFNEPVIKEIADKYKRLPAQILLNWGIARGTIVIPKSVKPERIEKNANVFDFELTPEDMRKINSLNKNERAVYPIQWGFPYFA